MRAYKVTAKFGNDTVKFDLPIGCKQDTMAEAESIIATPNKENILDIVANATYMCYAYNRKRAPDITPQQWRTIFKDTLEYEKKYQEELK